jgi:two-component sensor histidine kinase/HAMP domain-containing protein
VSVNISKEAEVKRWINASQSHLRALAQRPLVREYAALLSNPAISSEERNNIREKLLINHFYAGIKAGIGFIDLSLLHKDRGRIMVSTESRLVGKYRENESFFQQGKRRTFVDEVSFSLTLEQMVMHVSTPVSDEKGALIAVLSGHVNWQEMTNIMLQGSGMSKSEESYLINRFHYFVTESRFTEDFPFKKTVYTKGAELCLAQKEGIDLYVDYRGIQVIGAFRLMPEYGLCILTEEDQDEAFAPAVIFRNMVLGVSVGIGVLSTLLSVYFAHTITTRINSLVQGAEAFADGRFDIHIKEDGNDELGLLAKTFNHMAQARKKAENTIKRSRDQLEVRVKERTAEITYANDHLKREVRNRKAAEAKIQRSLSEKEVLLREIHHRVKNNMQMIQSLLNLQANKMDNALFKAALIDSNSRIKSMALIHEALYRSEDIAKLDIDGYFKQLVKHLYKIYLKRGHTVETVFQIEPISFDLDSSIACGLILNELVTNALKYAFTDSQKGILTILLYRVNDAQVELTVKDNGQGLDAAIDLERIPSLGLKIVSMLAQDQLQGNIHIGRKEGTSFNIRFPG